MCADNVTTSRPDLVLRARLQLLRSSLLTVQRALQDLESHRHAGPAQADLMEVTTDVLAALKGLGGRRDQVSEACQGDTEMQELLMTWLHELEPIAAQAEKALSQPPKRPFLILDDTSVDENLREDVTNQLDELDRIEAQVISAAGMHAGREVMLAQIWSAYRDAEVESRTLFAEYLDLVRGVLLRDAGFDNELCRISDALIRSWGRFKDYAWQSLTIPASHERDEASVARLIRIGFPEWTIWSLPLTGCELGHVFAARHDAMRDLVQKLSDQTGHKAGQIRSWVADAFAAGVMGPAYAWAVLLLRTDPLMSRDRDRMEVILTMLDKLASAKLSTYPVHIQRIREEWEEACRQQPSPGPLVQDTAADPAIEQIVSAVYRRLQAPFNDTHWSDAERLADKLAPADGDPTGIAQDLQLIHLRNLLVGAWLARVRLVDASSASGLAPEDFSTKVDALTERVRTACAALVDAEPPLLPGTASPRTTATVAQQVNGANDKPRIRVPIGGI